MPPQKSNVKRHRGRGIGPPSSPERCRGGFDDDSLSEVTSWIDHADRDDSSDIRRAREAAQEAEKNNTWD